MSEWIKFVFCEGEDDLAVVSGIAKSIGLPDLRIEQFRGKDRLRSFLEEVQKRPEFGQEKVAAVAVIRDADSDASAAFISVRDSLKANNFEPCPRSSGEVAGTKMKVGILVIGPNDGKGILEDLCLNSVSDRPEFGCVDDYFGCITEKSGRQKFSAKAKVRVWMASHVDHEYYVGKAAEEGYWPWSSPVFDGLKNFLRQL